MMTKQMIYWLLLGFLAGCAVCAVSSLIGDWIRKRAHRRVNDNVDPGYDISNPINQAPHSWQPVEIEGHKFYKVQ